MDIKILPCGPSAVAKVLAFNTPGSHRRAGSYICSPTSHPAPCLWPGKAVKDGSKSWDRASVWETQMKLLAPGFGLAQLQPLRSLGE